MEEILKKRIEELDLKEDEREFILNNIEICNKIYLRGIRDSILIQKD